MTIPPSLTTAVQQHPNMIATDMDGEVVMMSIEQGEYYGLDELGAFLWNQMITPISLEALCQKVLDEFEVDEATCQTDVLSFITRLIDQGIVQQVD